MAYSRTYFTVKTNGQALVVSATAPGGGSSALHLTSAVSSAVTQPYTITSDTTFYVLDELAGDYILSAKQPDGTELFGKAVKLQPGDPKTVEPVPSGVQVGADNATRVHPRYLSTGELVVGSRSTSAWATGNGVPTGTGVLQLTYFTALKTELTAGVTMVTAATGAGATPTLCKYGLYAVDDTTEDLTLVASTANDTTLFANTHTAYNKAFSTPYTRTAGQRYAVGLLVVTGATFPTFYTIAAGSNSVLNTEIAQSPREAAVLGSQTDLPASAANSALSGARVAMYARLT